jgi:hypothetical protein
MTGIPDSSGNGVVWPANDAVNSGPGLAARIAADVEARNKRIADAAAEREKRERKRAEERAQRRREEAQAEVEAHLETMRQRWIGNGGTLAEWGPVEKDLRRQWLQDRLGADDELVRRNREILAATGEYPRL